MSVGSAVLDGGSAAGAVALEEGNSVQKFAVLIVDADGHAPVRGSDRLQKMMFMASKAIDELGVQCRFEPGEHGPHSKAVGEEMARLASMGLLSDNGGDIAIAPEGARLAKVISAEVGEGVMNMLYNQKEFLNDMTEREALGYICAAYPEVAARSAEYAKLRPDIEAILLSLIRKEKITSGHAAELLGKPLEYVLKLVREAGLAYLHY